MNRGPENLCGRPVRDGNFFGRDDEVDRLLSRLETDHVLLAAPRRVGKTSLMYRLCQVAPRRGWLAAVYVSAEEAGDERALVAELFATVALAPGCEHVREALAKSTWGQAVGKVRELSVATLSLKLAEQADRGWEPLAAAFEHAIQGLPPGRRLLIMIDELPGFLLQFLAVDRERATRFLRWFRALRQGPAQRSDDVRWLVAGSVGLVPLASRERWSALINDLLPFALGPYPEEVARAFLAALAERYALRFEDDAVDAILSRAGWPIPFYLQLYVSELRGAGAGLVGTAAVEAAHAALLGADARKHFAPWRERLVDELGAADAAAAKALLDAAGADPRGATLDTLVGHLAGHLGGIGVDSAGEDRRRWLLEVLEGDGYLVEHDGRWRFRSPLLREFWTAGGRR